jgi:hypothetical protein
VEDGSEALEAGLDGLCRKAIRLQERRFLVRFLQHTISSILLVNLKTGTHSNLIIYALEAYKSLLRIIRRLLSSGTAQ